MGTRVLKLIYVYVEWLFFHASKSYLLHCALSCAVYCNHPCLFVCVCLWVRLTTASAQCLRRLWALFHSFCSIFFGKCGLLVVWKIATPVYLTMAAAVLVKIICIPAMCSFCIGPGLSRWITNMPTFWLI